MIGENAVRPSACFVCSAAEYNPARITSVVTASLYASASTSAPIRSCTWLISILSMTGELLLPKYPTRPSASEMACDSLAPTNRSQPGLNLGADLHVVAQRTPAAKPAPLRI